MDSEYNANTRSSRRRRRREGSELIARDRKCEDDEHVEGLPDGIGCTEIWEHLSERRAQDEEKR